MGELVDEPYLGRRAVSRASPGPVARDLHNDYGLLLEAARNRPSAVPVTRQSGKDR